MLDNYKQQTLALELIKRKARITTIQKATGLSVKWLRQAFREYHGYSARSGNDKQSIEALTRTNRQYKEVTLFAVCYQASEMINHDGHIQNIIQAFDVYKMLCPSSRLDFADAVMVSKDLKDQKIQLTNCPNCGAVVLIGARESYPEKCTVCRRVMS